MIRSMKQLPLEGRRVFLRVDLNAPLSKDAIPAVTDDTRIQAALPTIKHCIERGARIILASHLGRPKGEATPKLSLEPVAGRLAELLNCEIRLTDEPVGDGARKVCSDLREGQIALLENLRFNSGEKANDTKFAETLASYADIYINDAFGTSHRAHASTAGMVSLVNERGAGFVMNKEIEALGKLLNAPKTGYVAIIGGAKISDKIDVLDALLSRVETILIGGAMANTFLLAQGKKMGKSLVEDAKVALAKNFLRKASQKHVTVMLPQDLVVADNFDDATGTVVSADEVPATLMALDIGPEAAARYADAAKHARTLFWNGPMGVFEKPAYAEGTFVVAKAVADNEFGYTVVGGGDSAAAVHKAGIANSIRHVSTGGGAALEFIQGLTLPGIAALEIDE
ncbi:MAG: phosphoglycerate kinase [Myxococcales bacterium]|nr:phosphoglycerate kinase [Myxococcales bacterium]